MLHMYMAIVNKKTFSSDMTDTKRKETATKRFNLWTLHLYLPSLFLRCLSLVVITYIWVKLIKCSTNKRLSHNYFIHIVVFLGINYYPISIFNMCLSISVRKITVLDPVKQPALFKLSHKRRHRNIVLYFSSLLNYQVKRVIMQRCYFISVR